MRNISRPGVWLVVGLALVVGVFCLTGAAQSKPANVVLIVADDMGYADIGVHGGRDIPTPNIDALMKGGTRFTDAYVTGPYCSPTRAGLLTGRYPGSLRIQHRRRAEDGGVRFAFTEKTLAIA
jgi:arylsulfatase A-like enzyme